MLYNSQKLDAYLASNHRDQLRFDGPIKLTGMGDGTTRLDEWPEELGKAPTREEVDAYDPQPPAAKVDYAAEVDAAVTRAKSARTVVSAIEITERLAARLADIEARLAKLGL